MNSEIGSIRDPQVLRNILGKKNSSEIHWKEVRDLEHYMVPMVKKMKQCLLRGDYGLLVGDDASGRVITLILRDIINRVNRSRGEPTIPTIFLQPDKSAYQGKKLEDEFKKEAGFARADTKKKALVVTEYILYGRHIKQLGDILYKQGYLYDVAATAADPDWRSNFFPPPRVFVGVTAEEAPSVYRAARINGLSDKRYLFDELEEADELYDRALPLRGQLNSLGVSIAREDAKKMAKRVYEKVFSSSASKVPGFRKQIFMPVSQSQ